ERLWLLGAEAENILEKCDREVQLAKLLQPVRDDADQSRVFDPEIEDSRQDAKADGAVAPGQEMFGAVEKEAGARCMGGPLAQVRCVRPCCPRLLDRREVGCSRIPGLD